MSMRKLTPCGFNIDSACVELRYTDGETLSLYTPRHRGQFRHHPAHAARRWTG